MWGSIFARYYDKKESWDQASIKVFLAIAARFKGFGDQNVIKS